MHVIYVQYRQGLKQQVNKMVLEPQVLPVFAITYFSNHCSIWLMNQKINDPKYPKITFNPTPEGVTSATIPKDH